MISCASSWSKPVVITGLLAGWEALTRWSPEYLWRKARDSRVKLYSSPDGDFESVRGSHEELTSGGGKVCAGCSPDETVLSRPAETEISFEHFLWLADGYSNPERASFYLQKHPIHKWAAYGLDEDVRPQPHDRIAPFLKLNSELLWLSLQVRNVL